MDWYLKVLKQYADFRGRARRKEYWMFTLFNTIIIFIISAFSSVMYKVGFALYVIYTLAMFVPSLAVSVRRLHDVGKSGWMLLLGFLPVIGWIWLLMLAVREGEPGENIYGKNPKEETTSEVM